MAVNDSKYLAEGAEEHEGLVNKWPFNAEKKTYPYWDGTLGRATVSAIKDFEKANGLSPTGSFTDELIKRVYEISGKKEPPIGHLFVRQEFARLFDVPVSFRNPDKPLGTHLFTAMKFVPGETRTQWIVVSLEGDDPVAALDRLEIPDQVRSPVARTDHGYTQRLQPRLPRPSSPARC